MTGVADSKLLPAGRAALTGLVLASLVAVAAWALFLSNRAPGTAAALDGFPLDDAWIHLVYARSLATEGGFFYNPGVAETGMTSPLWVVFAASVHLVAAPFGVPAVVFGTKILSLLFGIGCVWALFALARSLGLATWSSLLVASLCAVDPALTFSRATGMEVPLFTLLVLVSLALALKGELAAAAVATGLVLVARPEGALIVPSVIVLLAASVPRAVRTARRVAAALVGAALPSLLWVSFCLAATGRPLPNTFYAKFVEPARSGVANLALGWREYVRGAEPYFTFEIGTALALAGAAALVARQRSKGAAVLAAGALLFAGTLASRSVSAGHFHYWERWLIPAYPILLLAFGAGIELATRWIGRVDRALWLARTAAVALCALLVAPLPATLMRRAAEYAWNCQNIEELNVAVGRWIDQNVEPDGVVAVIDAGATRYFGNRETVDLFGLNDHRIRAAKGVQAQVDYLRARGVGWLVLVPEGGAQRIEALRLESVFEVSAPNFTISGARQGRIAVYRWPRAAP